MGLRAISTSRATSASVIGSLPHLVRPVVEIKVFNSSSAVSEGTFKGYKGSLRGGDWAGKISEVTDELTIFADSSDIGLVAFVEGTYHLGSDLRPSKRAASGKAFIKGGLLFTDVEAEFSGWITGSAAFGAWVGLVVGPFVAGSLVQPVTSTERPITRAPK